LIIETAFATLLLGYSQQLEARCKGFISYFTSHQVGKMADRYSFSLTTFSPRYIPSWRYIVSAADLEPVASLYRSVSAGPRSGEGENRSDV